jgi:O-antigen/teichoic acid export membrane protein
MTPINPEDRNGHLFKNRHLVADLNQIVVRGGFVKMASQAVKFVLGLASVVIMARLIKPADFGVYIMGTSFMYLLAIFQDAGLTKATVQRPEINHRQISTLFWVNAAVGTALGLLMVVSAPVVAGLYGDPRVEPITLALGITFVFTGLSVQHGALLQRQLRFRTLEMITLAAQITGAIAMYASAWRGAGYWSLVLNILVTRAVETLLTWWFSGWRPGWPRRDTGVRGMLTYGFHLSGYNFVDYFHRSLDNILIGRYWGAQALGFYSKAYGLLTQPLIQIGEPITAVMVPALSRLQDDPKRYRGYFIKGAQAVAFLGMPLVVFTYVDAREIILILLGAPWLAVVPLFKALAPAAMLGTTSMFGGWLFQSLGRTDRMFKSGTAVLGVMIVAFVGGLPWGAMGVATAYSISYCLVALPAMAYATRETPVTLADIAAAIRGPFILSIACGAATIAFKGVLHAPEAAAARGILDGGFYCLAYAAAWAVFPGGREFIASIADPFIGRYRGSVGRRGASSALPS